MGLLEEIRADGGEPVRCRVGRLLQALNPEDAEGLRTALADAAGTTTPQIFRALRRRYDALSAEVPEGDSEPPMVSVYRVTQDAIYRHRQGACRCKKHGLA